MQMRAIGYAVLAVAAAAAAGAQGRPASSTLLTVPRHAAEVHLANVKQLTFAGDNAEAYWSNDGSKIIFQAKRDGAAADRVYIMNADGSGERMVSSGYGRCTCAFFMKGDREVLFASTEGHSHDAPPPVDRSKGYVWPVYPYYAIYRARIDGTGLTPVIPKKVEPGKPTAYYAEATVSADGKRIVFTSSRDGDIDIYSMDSRGNNVKRLTRTVGYDGGPVLSPDGKMIAWRAWYPQNDAEKREYLDLLAQHLVKPSKMELWVARSDGSQARQVTHTGAANFAPYFTPDGKGLIFSSNLGDPAGRTFELYKVALDGTGLEQVTRGGEFDSFPMFSRDGKKLVWCSNRCGPGRKTNVFVADWVP